MTDTTHSNAPPAGYEHDRAIMEAERNASTERVCATYGFCFDPQGRQRYEAGYFNGWRRALQVAAPKSQAVQAPQAPVLGGDAPGVSAEAPVAVQAQAADPWRSAVLDLIDDCPGLTMEQDRWLSRRVKELDFASAPAVQVGAGEDERTQPFYDLAWQHGARQGVSFAGDDLESLTFSPDDFEKFCTVLADRAARGAAAVPAGMVLLPAADCYETIGNTHGPRAYPMTQCKVCGAASYSSTVDHKPGCAVGAAEASPAAPVAAAVQAPAAGQQAGGVRDALKRLERLAHRQGELWERCQGKGWPDSESNEFDRLRDDLLPAARAACTALATTPAPEAEQAAPADVRVPSDAEAHLTAYLEKALATIGGPLNVSGQRSLRHLEFGLDHPVEPGRHIASGKSEEMLVAICEVVNFARIAGAAALAAPQANQADAAEGGAA